MSKVYVEKLFSNERMAKYFAAHPGNEAKAIVHYQCNLSMAEAFYPTLSVLEVALRNSVNRELTERFGKPDWYNQFSSTAGLAKLNKEIANAQYQITKRREVVMPSKVVAELTLGFWVRLFNAEFELILWKDLRRAFPYLEKSKRQRHNVSAPLNNFRNFRNRVFHNEPICWSFAHLRKMHDELHQTMSWINKDLPGWMERLDRFDTALTSVIAQLK